MRQLAGQTFFSYLVIDSPRLTALNGLTNTRTPVTERLHLAVAAKLNRKPVCLVGKNGRTKKARLKERKEGIIWLLAASCNPPSSHLLFSIMKINPR